MWCCWQFVQFVCVLNECELAREQEKMPNNMWVRESVNVRCVCLCMCMSACVCACESKHACLLSSVYVWGVCMCACPCVCLHALLFLTPCPAVDRPRRRLHQSSPGCKWTPRPPPGRPPPGPPTWSVPPTDVLILGRERGERRVTRSSWTTLRLVNLSMSLLCSLHFHHGIHEVFSYKLSYLWIFWCNRQTLLS